MIAFSSTGRVERGIVCGSFSLTPRNSPQSPPTVALRHRRGHNLRPRGKSPQPVVKSRTSFFLEAEQSRAAQSGAEQSRAERFTIPAEPLHRPRDPDWNRINVASADQAWSDVCRGRGTRAHNVPRLGDRRRPGGPRGLLCAHLEANGQCEKWLRI